MLRHRRPRAGRIQKADRLVGQLARRNVALRQLDSCLERFVKNDHLMMLYHRWHHRPQHGNGIIGFGLTDIDGLEPPRQCRVFLEILAVFCPGSGGDGAQRPRASAGLRRLAASPVRPAAGSHKRMSFIDKG